MRRRFACVFLMMGLAVLGSCQERPAQELSAVATQASSAVAAKEMTVERTEQYPESFSVYGYEAPGFLAGVQIGAFSEEEAQGIFDRLREDYQSIAANLNTQPSDISVYVVKKVYGGRAFHTDHTIYVSAEDVECGRHRELMCRVLFDLQSEWQGIGLDAYLFGELPDTEMLTDFYRGAIAGGSTGERSDILVLSLFPGFFLEEFASDRQMLAARQTAIALTRYLIELHSLSFFSDEGCRLSFRTDWLLSLGISVKDGTKEEPVYAWSKLREEPGEHDIRYLIESPYAERVASLSWHYTPAVPLRLTDLQTDFSIRKTETLDTAADVYQMLFDYYCGMDILMAYLEANAPEACARIKQREDEQLCYVVTDAYTGHLDRYTQNAVITGPDDIHHETIHLLFFPDKILSGRSGLERFWMIEGLAMYLDGYVLYPYREMADELKFFQPMEEMSSSWEPTEEVIRSLELLTAGYRHISGADVPGTDEELDRYAYWQAWAYVSMTAPELKTIPSQIHLYSFQTTRHFGTHVVENDLNYYEAMVFIDFLARRHGLDAVIDAEMYEEEYYRMFPGTEDFEQQLAECTGWLCY